MTKEKKVDNLVDYYQCSKCGKKSDIMALSYECKKEDGFNKDGNIYLCLKCFAEQLDIIKYLK